MTQTAANHALELLLVDDDTALRSDIAAYFSRNGHRVEQCEGGAQALELLERRSFDVIVLDMMMPGMSGLDVLKELQSRHAECEVVVLTGEATVAGCRGGHEARAREFLTKPISLKELDRLVRKAYETGQLRKENRQLESDVAISANIARHDRRFASNAGNVSAHCAGRPDRQANPHPRRERNWERACGPGIARSKSAGGQAALSSNVAMGDGCAIYSARFRIAAQRPVSRPSPVVRRAVDAQVDVEVHHHYQKGRWAGTY